MLDGLHIRATPVHYGVSVVAALLMVCVVAYQIAALPSGPIHTCIDQQLSRCRTGLLLSLAVQCVLGFFTLWAYVVNNRQWFEAHVVAVFASMFVVGVSSVSYNTTVLTQIASCLAQPQ